MLHSPELLLQLHKVEWAERYDDLRVRSRGMRPGLARRAWSTVRTVGARADSRQPDSRVLDCGVPCAA